VASPPPKPLLIYDGDCNFCTLWIRRWQHITEGSVDYLPCQDPSVAAQFPEIPREQFETAVQLIQPDGTVCSAAEAVFSSLAYVPDRQWMLRWYQYSPPFARLTEWGYHLVARHRTWFSFLTRLFWGRHVEPSAYRLGRWIFLRALGIIYLIAFWSLWMQVTGLIGSHGILPVNQTISQAQLQFDIHNVGADRYRAFPTLCWFNRSDAFLNLQCATGVAAALLLIVGIAPSPCLFLLWLIYLSLSTVGLAFLNFQWDTLLLETGFLAIFLAPLQLRPRWPWNESPPSRLIVWLFRWLLFRLMFESGCVKLFSGDPTWRNLTALSYHYETQPLPTWIGWYAFQLPLWFQKISAMLVFVTELVVPFLVLMPRRLRQWAAWPLVILQVLILLTGNYCFFNLLTMALCLLLFDDAAFRKLIPGKWRVLFTSGALQPKLMRKRWPHQVVVPVACVAVMMTAMGLFGSLRIRFPWPSPMVVAYEWLVPFRTFNNYGLFAVMTTSRREIVVEGSHDGIHWLPYEFKYKPGNLKRRPAFVEPYQPRLDWQMWFAALSGFQQNPWFANFVRRLLEGSPPVLALLGKNPFPEKPPRYIRAVVYDYKFTNFKTRAKTGDWWQRKRVGLYLPITSLRVAPNRAHVVASH